MHLGSTTTLTEEYLSEKYPMVELEENVMINASFFPMLCWLKWSNLSQIRLFLEEKKLAFIRMKIKKK
jgi:hypothetical protein